MKNYDETINSVFERMKEYEIKKRKTRKQITGLVACFCCVCVVVLVGISFKRKNNPDVQLFVAGKTDNANTSENQSNISEDKTTINNYEEKTTINNETADNPDSPVIWGEEGEVSNSALVEWNGKKVTMSLETVLENNANKNVLIAVSPCFMLDKNYVHNGKTLSEYEREADNEDIEFGKLGQLLKWGDELKRGEDLYKTPGPDGTKWAKEFYEEQVEFFGEDFLAKYIVDGEFLKEKVETDIQNYKHTCRTAYEVACNAYYEYIVEETIKKLEKENINYERNVSREFYLVIYVTADEFKSLSLDNVLVFGLSEKNGSETTDMVVEPC